MSTMSEAIAVAIMVDSSLALAVQWPQVLVQYISVLLTRLIENRSSTQQFHIGFVTYAPADVRPTPILAKRYFSHPSQVTKEFKEEPSKLGIGRTGFGGRKGMAALEGYVAALELFDLFLSSREVEAAPNSVPFTTCHIIHITCSSPDSTTTPLWNQDPALDNVSWQTLPEELQKRNINLSMVLLRPDTRFSELHKQVAPQSNQPWFPTRPGHVVLLSGFPLTKRSAENLGTENSSDPKRARISSTDQSPPQPPDVTSSHPHPTETTPGLSRPMMPRPVSAQPQPGNIPTPAMIQQRIRVLEASLKAQAQAVHAAQQAGSTPELENIKKEMQAKMTVYFKLKSLLAQVQATSDRQDAPPADSGQAGGNIASTSDGGSAAVNISSSLPPHGNPPPANVTTQPPAALNPAVPDRQALAQLVQNRFSQPLPAQSSIPNALRMPSNIPPDVAAQMQKLLEQRRSPHIAAQQNVPHGTLPKPDPQTWQGSLTWTGFDAASQSRKDVTAEVIVTGKSGGDIRSDTWPSKLTLIPSHERSVPLEDLQSWIRRFTPRMCTIFAQPRTLDPKINESNFKSLNTLLLEKGLYALASWKLPSGKEEINMIIFPLPSVALAAAVFPETGVPELPKAIGPQATLTGNPAHLPNVVAPPPQMPGLPSGFQNWSLQQKQEFASKMIQFRQNQQAQQQAQAQSMPNSHQPTRSNDLNLFPPGQPPNAAMANANPMSIVQNVASMMGGVNVNQPHSNITGFHRRQPSGGGSVGNSLVPGGMQNVSMEMLQSFMQRNPDGMGGSGPG